MSRWSFHGYSLALGFAMLAFTSACFQMVPFAAPGVVEANPVDTVDATGVNWNLEDPITVSSGLGESTLSSFYEQGGTAYCFENYGYGDTCKRADKKAVTAQIATAPVAIRGFQLNFAKQSFDDQTTHNAVVVSGAWITTAELDFNPSSGAMRLTAAKKTTIHDGACNLNDVASDASGRTVGYRDDGRILTGLYFSDEYDLSSSSIYLSGTIKAARVYYSGVVTTPEVDGNQSSCGALCWSFLPTGGNPVSTDFGAATFVTSHSSSVLVSNYFGLTSKSDVSNWAKRVITGFCIRGYKQLSNGGQRSLLHHVRVRTHAPVLVRE